MNVELLERTRASVADPFKPMNLGKWTTCIFAHLEAAHEGRGMREEDARHHDNAYMPCVITQKLLGITHREAARLLTGDSGSLSGPFADHRVVALARIDGLLAQWRAEVERNNLLNQPGAFIDLSGYPPFMAVDPELVGAL